MAELPVPDDKWLAEKFRQIDAALAELKAARPMVATVQHGGSFALQDTDGTVVWRFGEFNDGDGGAAFGIGLYDVDGATVLGASDSHKGLLYPHEYHQWIVPTAQSITSGTFVSVAECEVIIPNADTIAATGAIITPAATTAEVQILESRTGLTTNVVTVPASSNGLVVFEWIHPFTVGWGDHSGPTEPSPFLHWQVRRASGAGTVTAFPPRHLTFRDHIFTPSASTAGGGRLTA